MKLAGVASLGIGVALVVACGDDAVISAMNDDASQSAAVRACRAELRGA